MKHAHKFTDLTQIDPDSFNVELDDESLSSSHIEAGESGMTSIHRQNMDEQRIDEILVEDSFNEQHYPTMSDIADPQAVDESYKN